MIGLRFLKETPALKSFLRNNPFVSIDRNGQYHVCGFADRVDASAEKRIERWRSDYYFPDAMDLHVYTLSPYIRLASSLRIGREKDRIS
jgi:hypothetical protein